MATKKTPLCVGSEMGGNDRPEFARKEEKKKKRRRRKKYQTNQRKTNNPKGGGSSVNRYAGHSID